MQKSIDIQHLITTDPETVTAKRTFTEPHTKMKTEAPDVSDSVGTIC